MKEIVLILLILFLVQSAKININSQHQPDLSHNDQMNYPDTLDYLEMDNVRMLQVEQVPDRYQVIMDNTFDAILYFHIKWFSDIVL